MQLGLEWIYPFSGVSSGTEGEQLQEHSQESESIAPPTDALELLWDLGMKGRVNRIVAEIEAIEQLEPRLVLFVRETRLLANNFQIKQIRAVLKEYPSQKG